MCNLKTIKDRYCKLETEQKVRRRLKQQRKDKIAKDVSILEVNNGGMHGGNWLPLQWTLMARKSE